MSTTTDNAQGLSFRKAIRDLVLAWECDGDPAVTRCKKAVQEALATQEVVGGKTADSPPQQERAAVPDLMQPDSVGRLYANGWNACRAEMLATAPAAPATPESAEPVAWRGLNELGEVVTEWQDGVPPKTLYDLCGKPAHYASIQVAYAHPTPAASDGGLREALKPLADVEIFDTDGDDCTVAWLQGPKVGRFTVAQVRAARAALAASQASTPAAVACRLVSYDGATKCYSHDRTWGAVTNPDEPCTPTAVDKAWCERMAALESDADCDITAGSAYGIPDEPAAVPPEQVTDVEAEAMLSAIVGDSYSVREFLRSGDEEVIRAAGKALLALRAAQQKGAQS